jgi:hypothetical protein
MEFARVARLICGASNEYQRPKAIAHVEKDRFLAWNECFKAKTGYSEEELCSASLKEFIDLGEPDSELPTVVCGIAGSNPATPKQGTRRKAPKSGKLLTLFVGLCSPP